MRYTTKTEYALICLTYMARHTEKKMDPISIKEMAKAEQFSATYMEKIFQALRGAKIVTALHGNQGGYVLSKPPRKITLRKVIEALEGQTFEAFCEPDVRKEIICTHFSRCSVKPLWHQTKNLLDSFFDTMTIEMLAKNELKTPAKTHS